MDKVVISDSPHVRRKRTTKGIMLDVLIALVPVVVASIVFFGGKSAFLIAISSISCVATEFVWLLCKKVKIKDVLRQFDFTSLITGVILALTLPPLDYSLWYVPVISGIFAVGAVKMLFGGTGKNVVNPAICGRVFAFIAFSGVMVSGWIAPNYGSMTGTIVGSATPLTQMLNGENISVTLLDMFLGTGLLGSVGETCKIAMLVGGIYLVVRKVIKPAYPIIYIVITGLVSSAMAGDIGAFVPSILGGGLMFGAVFMATDYVTSPNNKLACYLYYAILGVVTALLRYGTKIEVVSFAILLMNLLVPLFNAYIKPRRFGAKKISVIIKENVSKIRKNGKPKQGESL